MTACQLLSSCLERIADPKGEGAKTFTRVYAERARVEAEASDRLRAAGVPLGPLAGRIVSIKDLLDVAGEPTTAGSIALRDAPPAASDAPVVERLRRAGAIIVGKTNMTEFALSGLGINPHYDTPGNPADRARVPGGSSSGAAVSVADRMCEIAIGSDTGGSIRIPAAFCGVVGFKPTARRVPREGCIPLSTTLDSLGPLAGSVADCAIVDAVLAGEAPEPLGVAELAGLRLLEPTTLVMDELDPAVAAAYGRARVTIEHAGARIESRALPLLDEIAPTMAGGVVTLAEAAAWHRDLIVRRGAQYDPRVRQRIEVGLGVGAVDYIAAIARRATLVAAMDRVLAGLDALIMPTTPGVAPPFGACASDEGYARENMRTLRNPTVANFFDLCAISLPIRDSGAMPVGLMLVGRHGADRRLLAIAAAAERALHKA